MATGAAAREVAARGWWRAQRWLVLRRLSQAGVFGLFLLGPLAGLWIVEGNLAASLTLGVLPLTDPFVLLQSLLAGHAPKQAALLGALLVAAFYALVGGRVYCAWVCPLNVVTDAAAWLRRRLGIAGRSHLPRATRRWVMAAALALAAATGTLAWELVNPVSMVQRGIVFGMGLAWLVAAAVFLLDLLVSPRAWCGRLCPVGACYGLLGGAALVRVNAPSRARCDECGDCYAVCPEPHVIRPALKGARPLVLSADCTNCGRCVDVCARQVFAFGTRFENVFHTGNSNKQEVQT